MKEKNKQIKLKGNGWSIKTTAIGVPTFDVSLDVKIAKTLTQEEVPAEERKLKGLIKEWFDDSKLNPEHLIVSLSVPTGYGYQKGPQSMIFLAAISVATRKEIQLGAYSFQEIFMPELERLIECLELE